MTATLVDHPPVVPAFAYRLDASDRSIVVSGDTLPSDNRTALTSSSTRPFTYQRSIDSSRGFPTPQP
jgi:hypothetical protein